MTMLHMCAARGFLPMSPTGINLLAFPGARRLGRASRRGLHQKLARLPDSGGSPWGEDERYRSIIPKGLLGRAPSLSSSAAACACLTKAQGTVEGMVSLSVGWANEGVVNESE